MTKNLIEKYNSLHGKTVSRKALEEFGIELFDALPEDNLEIEEIWNKIYQVLNDYPEANEFKISVIGTTAEMLNGIYFEEHNEDEEIEALGKAVSPEDIYNMITNKVLDLIKTENGLFWRKSWKQQFYGLSPQNFASKKPYRGINNFLLGIIAPIVREKDNLETLPYWLTFKQIEEKNGKLEKGSHGQEVIYFTLLLGVKQETPKIDFATYDEQKYRNFIANNASKLNASAKYFKIPILKYYKVFNAADISGIKFPEFKTQDQPTEPERIEIAEKIVKNYPNPPKFNLESAGDKAFYRPGLDDVTMPKLRFFDGAQEYYSTFFHELIHSTGNEKRLKRDFTGTFGTPKYAFEELVAELGALFLCAESGILYFTLNNSAAYIKGWQKRLIDKMKSDNKFFFRASSKAQAGADLILDRDEKGKPKYLKEIIKAKFSEAGAKRKPKVAIQPAPFAIKPKSVSVQTAIKNVLSLQKFKGLKPLQASVLFSMFKNDLNEEQNNIGTYKASILKNVSGEYIDFYFDEEYSWATLEPKGIEFVNSVKARLESLHNQKNNYALFDGLVGTAQSKETITFNKLMLKAKKQGINTRKVYEVGQTKDILKKYIGNNLIFISGATIKKSMQKDDDHNLQWNHLINLPDNVNNPLAIFNSKTIGYVVLTELKDYKNKPLMVVIHLSKNLKITEIKSIYSRTNNNIYKKWKNQGLLMYINKKSDLVKQVFGTIPKEITKSHSKVSKVISKKQEPTEKITVMMDEKPIITKVEPTAEILKREVSATPLMIEPSTPIIEKPLKGLDLKPVSHSNTANHKYFNISGPLAEFLGKVEIKPKDSVAWTLDAEQGAGKTRAFFRAINEFAKNYKVLFVSAEEHPESALFTEKQNLYIEKENQQNVYAIDETNFDRIKELIPHFEAVFFDSWNKIAEKNKGVDFDNDLRKGFDGKFFACIFQRTVSGTMRGGSKAQFDGDIISKMIKAEDYRDSYVKSEKNRYQKQLLNNVCWNIYDNEIFAEEGLNGAPGETVSDEDLYKEHVVLM